MTLTVDTLKVIRLAIAGIPIFVCDECHLGDQLHMNNLIGTLECRRCFKTLDDQMDRYRERYADRLAELGL